MTKNNVESLTGGQKFWTTIAGFSNIFVGYAIYFAFKDDENIRHQEIAKYMHLGAKTVLALIPISMILGLIVGIFVYNNF